MSETEATPSICKQRRVEGGVEVGQGKSGGRSGQRR